MSTGKHFFAYFVFRFTNFDLTHFFKPLCFKIRMEVFKCIGKYFFKLDIDASKGFIKEGKNNKLRASDIKRITDTVHKEYHYL